MQPFVDSDVVSLAERSARAGTTWEDDPDGLEIVVPIGVADAEIECRGCGGVQRARLTGAQISITPLGVHRTMTWSRPGACLVVRVPSALLADAGGTDAAIADASMRERPAVHDEFVRQLVRLIGADMLSNSRRAGDYLAAASRLLARHLMRAYSTTASSVVNGGLPLHKLRRATEFIDANLHRPIGLHDIAASVNASPYHFARMFRKSKGTSPCKYLADVRIEHAKTQLADSTRPIVEIAGLVGYESQSSFAAAFRKRVGATPKAFRIHAAWIQEVGAAPAASSPSRIVGPI